MDTRTDNGEVLMMSFELRVRDSISSVSFEIGYKSPGSKAGYTDLHRLIPLRQLITENIVKRSPIGYTILGAREVGCTRERQYTIRNSRNRHNLDWVSYGRSSEV